MQRHKSLRNSELPRTVRRALRETYKVDETPPPEKPDWDALLDQIK